MIHSDFAKLVSKYNLSARLNLKPLDTFKSSSYNQVYNDKYQAKNNFTPSPLLMSPLNLFNSQNQNNNEVQILWDQKFVNTSIIRSGLPQGYKKIQGISTATWQKITQTAKQILNNGNVLGTATPFIADGKQFIAVDQLHASTYKNGVKITKPGGIHGITVFMKT